MVDFNTLPDAWESVGAVTSAQVSPLAQIAIAEAQFTVNNLSKLQQYVLRRDVPLGYGSARFPRYITGQSNALVQGQEAANAGTNVLGVVLTPDYNAVYKDTITDIAGSNAPQWYSDFGRVAGTSNQRVINQQIWGLGAGATKQIGTTQVKMSKAILNQGRAYLQDEGATGEIFMAVTPTGLTHLFELYTMNNYNVSPETIAAIERGEAPSIFGIRIILCNGIVSDASGDVICPMWAREGIGYAVTPDPSTGSDFHFGMTYRAGLIGSEVALSNWYAVGIVNPERVVGIKVSNVDA